MQDGGLAYRFLIIFQWVSGNTQERDENFMKKILKRSLIALFLVLSMIVAVGLVVSVNATEPTIDHTGCSGKDACVTLKGSTTPAKIGTLNEVFAHVQSNAATIETGNGGYTITVHSANPTKATRALYLVGDVVVEADSTFQNADNPKIEVEISQSETYRGLFLTYSKSKTLVVNNLDFKVTSVASANPNVDAKAEAGLITIGTSSATAADTRTFKFTDVNVDILYGHGIVYQANRRGKAQYYITIE